MKKNKIPYLLILPQALLTLVFITGLINALVQSFGVMPSLGLTEPTFKYYKALFLREDFMSSLFFSVKISLIASVLSVILGVAFCAFLVQTKKTGGLWVRIVQMPIVVPHIVVALFMITIFSQNGIFARLLYSLGILSEQAQFPLLVFDRYGLGVIMGYLWKEVPFILYFVLALMKSIDAHLGEASRNLGAGAAATFFKVTLPLCLPTIWSGFLIIFAFTLGGFELPYLLGATIPKALPILSYIEYTHPDLRHRPYAMAMNSIIMGLSFISAWIYYRMLKRIEK